VPEAKPLVLAALSDPKASERLSVEVLRALGDRIRDFQPQAGAALERLQTPNASFRTRFLLLEPTAGQGRSLCAGVIDLAEYVANLDHHPRVGVCLDTCHAYAAGAPLDEPGGPTETVDRVLEAAPLRLVHANDSKDPRGSMRDRHEVLGDGHIGLEAFEELLAHPAMTGVPLILETPGSRDVGDPQIPLLKKLRP